MNDEYRELWNKVYIKITTLQKNENLPIEEKNVTAENQKYNFLRAYQMLGLSDHAADNMSGHGLKFHKLEGVLQNCTKVWGSNGP